MKKALLYFSVILSIAVFMLVFYVFIENLVDYQSGDRVERRIFRRMNYIGFPVGDIKDIEWKPNAQSREMAIFQFKIFREYIFIIFGHRFSFKKDKTIKCFMFFDTTSQKKLIELFKSGKELRLNGRESSYNKGYIIYSASVYEEVMRQKYDLLL